MARIDEAQLGRLSLLRAEEAVRVYQPGATPLGLSAPALYAKFSANRFARARSLSAVVRFRAMLPPRDGEFLDARARWPCALVWDGRDVVGFLVPELPADVTAGLAGQAGPAASRLAVAGQLCEAVGFLHERGWAFGDLSARTVAFALDPPRATLLDCDGAAALADSGRVQRHAPGWAPPEAQAPQDDRTDVYKLGLAIVAALGPASAGAPVADAGRLRGILPPRAVSLVGRALSPDWSVRPTALELAGAAGVRRVRHRVPRRLAGRPAGRGEAAAAAAYAYREELQHAILVADRFLVSYEDFLGPAGVLKVRGDLERARQSLVFADPVECERMTNVLYEDVLNSGVASSVFKAERWADQATGEVQETLNRTIADIQKGAPGRPHRRGRGAGPGAGGHGQQGREGAVRRRQDRRRRRPRQPPSRPGPPVVTADARGAVTGAAAPGLSTRRSARSPPAGPPWCPRRPCPRPRSC